MKFSRSYYLAFFLLGIIGCSSNDEPSEAPIINQDPIITEVKFTYLGEPGDPNYGISETIGGGIVINNKKQNITSEHFYDGESQGISPVTDYEYDNSGQLIKFTKYLPDYDDVQQYFHDVHNKLVGIAWGLEGDLRYYRIIYITPEINYLEKVSLPYNDPNNTVESRYILEFDEEDNVIRAGIDSDLDAVMDYVNNFTYSNNNLVLGQMGNGETFNKTYSTIIDTDSYLDDITWGKRNERLLCAEIYGSNSTNMIRDMKNSYNVSLQELEGATYEVLPNNFYKKRVEIEENLDPPYLTITKTLEFEFD